MLAEPLRPCQWSDTGWWSLRRAVGTPLFAGMLAATLIGIFLIPMLYVVFQMMRERTSRWFGGRAVREQGVGD